MLHAAGTAAEVDGLVAIESRFAPAAGSARRWLEPACGTGRYLRHARRRGITADGFDISPNMVRYAERALRAYPRGRVWQADAADFLSGTAGARYNFAFSTINTIRHIESDDNLHMHFARVAECLTPGGVYAVGIGTMDPAGEGVVEDVWHGARGRLRVTQTAQYIPPNPGERFETVISVMRVERPGGEQYIDSTYRLRTYTPAQWRSVLASAPMREIAAVDEQGDDVSADDPGYAIRILARR